ncbi:MAG: NFACT RNA binding domain-containing protein [Bacteroidia bacterium]|nr:NFACT RNA binding domain-containing protein [Bacteroidia bacterium]
MKFTAGLVTQLAGALQERLHNHHFYEAYSTGNDELYLVFYSNIKETFFSIRILWEARLCFLFFSDEPVLKPTPHYYFFNELKGQEVLCVFQHPGNRSFQIDFENDFQLVCKLYDGLSNVLLLHEGKLLYHFRKNITSDYSFSLARLVNEVKPETKEESFTDASSFFSRMNESNRSFLSHFAFEEEKRKLLSYYQTEIKKTTAYLLKTEQALAQLRNAVPLEEIGHLLMANLHLIPQGVSEYELIDFYRDRPLKIKLKKDLSAQQNAEVYYRKAKNKKNEEQQLLEQLSKAKSKLEVLAQNFSLAEQAQTLKQLKPLRPVSTTSANDKTERFKQFHHNGFTILVGKNAANNDELTFRYSHKNDLWLHARDVSGSHVIIRYRQGTIFPKTVIEYAASLAAYYSKAKGSSLVPVVYCERKFVRKPKGAAPGEVSHQKSEMIMAEPVKLKN